MCAVFFRLFQNAKPSICLTKELKISTIYLVTVWLLPGRYYCQSSTHIIYSSQNKTQNACPTCMRLLGGWWAAVWPRERECKNNCKFKIINFTLTCDIDRTAQRRLNHPSFTFTWSKYECGGVGSDWMLMVFSSKCSNETKKKLNVLYLNMQIFAVNECQIREQQNNKK